MKLLLTLIVLLWAASAEAQTWYVGKNGHDTNNDCNEAQNPNTPKLTINNVLDNCFTHGAGGGANKTVEVSAGTYVEALFRGDSWPKGSSWSQPFTLRGKPGDTVIIRPSSTEFVVHMNDGDSGVSYYFIFDNVKFNGENVVAGGSTFTWFVDYLRIQNSEFISNGCRNNLLGAPRTSSGDYKFELLNNILHNTFFQCAAGDDGGGGYLLYLSKGPALVDGNEWYNFNRFAMHIYSVDGCPSGVVVRNNRIHDGGHPTAEEPVILTCGTNHQVYNNVIWNTTAGIDLYQGGNNVAYNNTIYNQRVGCIFYGGSGHTARNNICDNPNASKSSIRRIIKTSTAFACWQCWTKRAKAKR